METYLGHFFVLVLFFLVVFVVFIVLVHHVIVDELTLALVSGWRGGSRMATVGSGGPG